MSYVLRAERLKARVKIQKCEFKFVSCEFKSTRFELKTNHTIHNHDPERQSDYMDKS